MHFILWWRRSALYRCCSSGVIAAGIRWFTDPHAGKTFQKRRGGAASRFADGLGPIRLLEVKQKNDERTSGVDLLSYGGVVANSYLPSNWISALGLYAWAQVDESSDNKSLMNLL